MRNIRMSIFSTQIFKLAFATIMIMIIIYYYVWGVDFFVLGPCFLVWFLVSFPV